MVKKVVWGSWHTHLVITVISFEVFTQNSKYHCAIWGKSFSNSIRKYRNFKEKGGFKEPMHMPPHG